jgi:hypothetical protein
MLTPQKRLSIRYGALMAIGGNSRGHAPEMIRAVMEPDRSWFNQNFLRRTVVHPRIRSEGMFPASPRLSMMELPHLSGVASNQE